MGASVRTAHRRLVGAQVAEDDRGLHVAHRVLAGLPHEAGHHQLAQVVGVLGGHVNQEILGARDLEDLGRQMTVDRPGVRPLAPGPSRSSTMANALGADAW